MDILNKINNKQSIIGIIGLGYVGLPLAIEFCKKGFKVKGFDTDPHKIKKLTHGESYIKHIDSSAIKEVISSLTATTDFKELSEVDCILICVPTPINKYREPDMTYINEAGRLIAQNLRRGQLIVLESTTYPGTTDEDLRGILEKSGFKAGQDFYLAFSPEREDPNNPNFSLTNIPKVVSGYSPDCAEVVKALYSHLVKEVILVSNTKVAEAAKLLENIYRAVNIALVNELKILFDKMDIDIWEVIQAAKTKPFGFQAFYPGPGLGGHCIPIDPFYLTWKAKEYDIHTKFIELAGEINTYMPSFVVGKVTEALNTVGKSVNGSKILILGMAYKKDIDDTRKSPAIEIVKILEKKGAIIDYNDPYVPELTDIEEYPMNKKSVDLSADNIKNFDCLVMVTDHSSYDVEMILNQAQLIVDTRNVFPISDKVIKS